MVHLAHKIHKKSLRKWSGFHLKNWLSPKNTKNPIKTKKKVPKSLSNVSRHHIDTIVYQISDKKDENWDH